MWMTPLLCLGRLVTSLALSLTRTRNRLPAGWPMWLHKSSHLTRTHVSSGSEGSWGCEMDMNLFEKIHADPNINYLNIHICLTTGVG